MFLNRKAVLHVDDDPFITRVAGEHLRSAGYDFAATHDPLEAAERVFRDHFRIVLLDIHMPGRSGLQVLSEIKATDAGVQVILLTALVNETTVSEAIRLGATACLFKPDVNAERLLEAVEAAYEVNSRWWESMLELTVRRQAGEAPAVLCGRD